MIGKNPRKRHRYVTWQPELHSVYRSPMNGGSVVATVDDLDETDRPTFLRLTDDDALRLAARLAQQVGHRVVPTFNTAD